MALILDHVFILTEAGAPAADRLVERGLIESHSRTHPGQGTSNRVFCFQDMALEFLWVHDPQEANTGPARELKFVERLHTAGASPFGLVLRDDDPGVRDMPFPGWAYQPDYFPAAMAFHIGENSRNLKEPLCIYVPFAFPEPSPPVPRNPGRLDRLGIGTPTSPSIPLQRVGRIPTMELLPDDVPLMELSFVDSDSIGELDLRPTLPLRLRGIT